MIEGNVTKNKKSIRHLKNYYMFLINDAESIFHDKPIQKYLQKQEYEQSGSKCNKWRSFIKTVFLGET